MRIRQLIGASAFSIAMLGAASLLTCSEKARAAPPAQPAYHDDDDDNEAGPVPSSEIVVTARQLDSARASINPALGASSYLLTNDAIEKRPSGEAANLVNVLMQMPGVTQGGDGAVRVRGQEHVQYRINNVILPEGLTDPADTLRARFAEKIELVTGALPAQYGLQTGGVVNITTKSGIYNRGGEFELYGGTQGRFEPAFEWAGSTSGTNYYVSGSYLRSYAGLPAPDSSSIPRNDHTDQGDAMAYLDRIIDDHSRVALILGVSDDRLQTPHAAGNSPAAAWGGRQLRASQYGMLSYQRSDAALNLQVAAFLNRGIRRLEPDTPGDLAFAGIARQNRSDALSGGLQAEAVYALGEGNHLRGGLLQTWRRTRDQAVDTVLASGSLLDLSGRLVSHRSETGLYLQDEWQVTARLTLNYGLRFDHVSDPGGGSALGPRASMVWAPDADTTLHLGYARYFVPAWQERDPIAPSAYTGTSATLAGSADQPALAERDDYIDLGLSRSFDELTLGIDVYWRRSRNLLDQTWSADGLVAHSFNHARGDGKGVELTATWSEGPLAVWSNLAIASLTGREIVSGQVFFAPTQLAWSVSHDVAANNDQLLTGSVGAAWRSGALRLSGDATWGSGLPRSTSAAGPNAASMPAWVSLNLAAVYRVTGLGHHPLDIRLDVLNALDGARQVQDGTGLAGGLPQWSVRRGVFIGLEQAL